MPRGTKRTVSLPPEEMIALGKEMIEWVKLNDPLHLSAWYSIEKMFTEKQWDAFTQIQEFLPYYEQALKIVGQKYLDKNSNVREGVSQRWQRVYFKDLRREEDEAYDRKLQKDLEKKIKELEHEAKLKSSVSEDVEESIKRQFIATMDQLSSLQSERKSASANISTDSKS